MLVYLAGQMTGLDDFGRSSFGAGAKHLRGRGHEVVSPVELDDASPEGMSGKWADYMARDIAEVARVDAVAVLPTWRNSKGASFEALTALVLGKPVFEVYSGKLLDFDTVFVEFAANWTGLDFSGLQVAGLPAPKTFRAAATDPEPGEPESVLTEAERLVHGPRGDDYGHPIHDFTRTAAIATAIISHKLRPGERITAKDWALFAVGGKISREVNRPKRDNRVDMAGYTETADMIETYLEGEAIPVELVDA